MRERRVMGNQKLVYAESAVPVFTARIASHGCALNIFLASGLVRMHAQGMHE